MNSNDQIFESYVPVYDAIPDKWEDSRAFIVEQLKKISNALNVREIGFYIDEEVLSGKAFIPGINLTGATNQTFRQVFRKVIDFGALPNAGIKSVPHGILVTDSFTLISMTAAATDPVNLISFPIIYADPTSTTNNISMNMTQFDVNITTGINYSSFTRTFIIIEYMQEL